MKPILYSLIITLALVSCNDNNKTKVVEESVIKTEKQLPTLNEALVYELKLTSKPIENIELKNVDFKNIGAVFFDNSNVSYLKISELNLNLGEPFNISFSYNTSSNDGSKPQTFLAFVDKYSSPARTIPLYIYTAGKRITGVYGNQTLWANSYDRTQGESKAYFDSYQLGANEFYFVSINFTGASMEIYINSELYASFENIKPHDLNFESLIIGSLPQGDGFVSPFKGAIHGLKIFNKSLSTEEIVEVYNGQPYVETITE